MRLERLADRFEDAVVAVTVGAANEHVCMVVVVWGEREGLARTGDPNPPQCKLFPQLATAFQTLHMKGES